ncbi:MAG: STAS domain-containing protein [Candidatus Heimdallarchaeota archaeon]|nr:STAS domain-containing protein [Candidatus Heimdallarchaeota archaeon]
MGSFIVDKKKNEVNIKFTDDLVSHAVEDLRETLKKLLSDSTSEIVLDFQSIDMIDSMGIGLLVSTHNTLTARNSRLIICNLSSDLLELFSVMRLNEFFTIK